MIQRHAPQDVPADQAHRVLTEAGDDDAVMAWLDLMDDVQDPAPDANLDRPYASWRPQADDDED